MKAPDYAPALENAAFQPYYDGLAAGALRITFVAGGDEVVWYPPDVVPGRPDAELEWRAVSRTGRAYSFTTVHRSLLPGDHRAETPFTVVLFEPDDAPGARIPGLLLAEDDTPPACEMRLEFRPLRIGDHMVAGFAPL